jgi:hypothetical protein
MAIEKKSLIGKNASVSAPTKKKPNVKSKVDTATPTASKVVAALKIGLT